VSGGCVADPVARAKGRREGAIHSPFHEGATGRSYQPRTDIEPLFIACQLGTGSVEQDLMRIVEYTKISILIIL
jgi:hypothetical protein